MKLNHLKGRTHHKRLGDIKNSFSYGVDYVLLEPEAVEMTPILFSHNRSNVVSLHDIDNGGMRSTGTGVKWVRESLRAEGLDSLAEMRILLLTQPRTFGHVFNPVSFWLMVNKDKALCGVIAEVNNTFGDRHSYFCHHDDLRPIDPSETITARKLFYVSPFQPVDGQYTFRFAFSDKAIAIHIELRHENGGIIATLTGALRPLTSLGILKAAVTRPIGSVRVLTLIFYQAMKLRLKGATYRSYTKPNNIKVSK
jgi:DUF1365 family protein